jgi:hypothetical protein
MSSDFSTELGMLDFSMLMLRMNLGFSFDLADRGEWLRQLDT